MCENSSDNSGADTGNNRRTVTVRNGMDATSGIALQPYDRYGTVAVALHWVVALLIVCNLILGLSMVPMPFTPRKFTFYLVHKWIGITVFLLACARLGWRAWRPPPPPVSAPLWQLRAAKWSHALLYALLLLVPVSGWIYSSSTGIQVVYLGLFPLPDLVPKDKTLAAVLKGVHVGLNSVLFLLVIAHVAAAMRHHFIQRDAVLARMLPLVRPRKDVQ